MIKTINLKNRVFTLPAKIVNVLDFNPEKLDVLKEGDDKIGIYYIDYDLDPLYLVIDDLKGYFDCNSIEENCGNKYLTLIFHDKDQKAMYTRVWETIKSAINVIASNRLGDYNKDYGMIKFDSDDDLPLGCTIKILSLVMVIRSVLEKDNRFYPQFFLDYCSYEA